MKNPAGEVCNYYSNPDNFAYECWKKRLNKNSPGNMKRNVTDRKDGKVTLTVTERCSPRQIVVKGPSHVTHMM